MLKHLYGSQIHIIDRPFLNGLLARLCAPETFQPEINELVELLYSHLIAEVMDHELETVSMSLPTRMTQSHPDCLLTSKMVQPAQKVVSVNIARAGTYPSHICFHDLHFAVAHQQLRQDHIFASRSVDPANHVTGTEISSTKIGGDIENTTVIFPDPMGATGNTLIAGVDYYKKNVPGRARKFIAIHLIVTPEYLRNVTRIHPDLVIYALRLDRGLSSEKVLASVPGTYWNEERGLNDKDYIVPGGGGFGEIMNNSFV